MTRISRDGYFRKQISHTRLHMTLPSAAKNIYDIGGLKPTITSQSQIQHINRQTAPSAQRQKHTGSNPPSHHDRHNNHTVDRRPTITCHRCGLPGHLAPDCKFKDRVCHTCGKKGHLAKVCRSRNRSKTSHDQQQGESNLHSLHNATPDSVSSSLDEATVPPEYTLNSIPDHKSQPIEVTVFVNGTDLQMEVDTGAVLSLISESTWSAKFPTCSLQPTDVKLRTYSGDPFEVKGTLNHLDLTQCKCYSQKRQIIKVFERYLQLRIKFVCFAHIPIPSCSF